MTAPALSVDRVAFRYPEATEEALRDVSLEVPEGAFALVVGPTGSGKSTLLRVTNGLVPHFSGGRFAGRVRTAGLDTRDHRPRDLARTVAFVPQDPAASFVLDRVEEEIAYGMENLGVDPERMRRRVEEMLDLLSLAPLRDRSVRTISGGERQRVAIAAALAAGPRILVLDEPTSQLDPQGAEDVLAALHRLVHDHGMTVIAAEHRLERVAGFADLAISMDGGRATAGSPEAILGRKSGPPVARLGTALGWEPVPLTVRQARAFSRTLHLPEPPRGQPRAGDPRLRARRLRAGFDGRLVLNEIDLTIHEGETVALMGRNGAGKTTLLRVLAGLHPPESGSVDIDGDVPAPGANVALCPQDPEHILYCDSVLEEIRATLEAQEGRLGRDPFVYLERLGIGDLASRHPRDLSSGQRLLVATAATAATGAPLLLLDEPTRGLDPEAKRALAHFFRYRASVGDATVFATHDVELAASTASRVVMLAAGEIVADGPVEQVLSDSHVFAPQMTRVFGAGWLTTDQVLEAVGR